MHSSGKSGQQLERKSFNSLAGAVCPQRAGTGEGGGAWGTQPRCRVVVPGVHARAGTGLIFVCCPLERLFQGEGACLGVHLQSEEPQAGQASVPLPRTASVGFSVHLAANHA